MQICELYLYDILCCAVLWFEIFKQFDIVLSMERDMFLTLLLCISYILCYLVPIVSINTESISGIVRNVNCLI